MLDVLYTPVSWVLLRWHSLYTLIGLSPAGGLNWTLSIISLVITARLLLFRLFVKQVKYTRHMQELQPEIKKLREKYKGDRAEQQRKMMEFQQEQGFNPVAGCLPMFLQFPVFISLFHVLRHISNSVTKCGQADYHGSLLTLYTFSRTQTCNASQAKLFGGAPLAGSLRDSQSVIENALHGDITTTRIVTVVLVLISASSTFFTQRLAASQATTVAEGTAATVQRLMKVFIPISVVFSGLFFPLGVVLYWFTSNTWTLAQQAYIIRYHPPTPKETVEAGVVGKALAPKVGQKPTRDAHGRVAAGSSTATGAAPSSAASSTSLVEDDDTPVNMAKENTAGGGTARPARSSTPRPGQRTQRTANRGPAKRPTQAKKRR